MADITEQASYTSGDTDIATVSDSGVITAVSAGETEITVSYEDETATVSVTVGEPEPELQGISTDPSEVNLTEGETENVTVTADYEGDED
ncbi:Ig-like domain-containing protein [Geomicrobium sp. JCM 19039]|uniref:Ig-like domain-containing protein n=1 Tax=Geomicrobium sp. JCM 19039 TaxID=1460636 RepID=UPI00045F32F9|nr:Ig-like domain-containing protein [Geomicrobium sp. JCM 19039]GAK12246.1 hypothetical protein JCM19039_2001 [Geomicrobium sp. JCM 19039]